MGYTPYYPSGWDDSPNTTTPIVAAALNTIEAGIEAAALASALASEVTRAGIAEGVNATAVTAEATRAATAEGLAALKANNLSDLASAATARANLGLNTAATQPSTAFDAAGLAAAAQAAAQSFATSAVGTETSRATTAEGLKAPIANPTFTGVVTAPVFAPTGFGGAVAASRYVGATVSGPPLTGTFAVGDWIIDQAGGSVWIATIAGAAPIGGQWRRAGDHSHQFRPESYGAVPGIFMTHDAVMSSTTSPNLTSASNLFTPSMAGWLALVNVGAAGANQAPFIGTIASYSGPGAIALSGNPAATAAGNPCIFGPDNTAALQACWAAAQSYAAASAFRSAEMRLADLYAMGSATTKGTTSGPSYGNSLLPINVADLTGAGSKLQLGVVCERGWGDELGYWESLTGQFGGSGIVVLEAAPATDGTWGVPSVIGGPTAASGTGWALTGGFANIRLHIDNLKIIAPYNPGWCGIDARFLACASGTRYGYQGFAVGVLGGGLGPNLGSTPGGGWNFNGAAIRFPAMNNNDLCDFISITAEGVADGAWIADHVSIHSLRCLNNFNALLIDNTSGSGSGFLHGSWIGYASFEANSNLINMSGTKFSHFPLVIGLLDSENSASTTDITDTGILTGLINWYNINGATPKLSGYTNIKIVNNRLAPGWWAGAPAVPLTGVAVVSASMPWREANVYLTNGDGAITSVTTTVNTSSGLVTTTIPGAATATSGAVISFPVPNVTGMTITVNFTHTSTLPTWAWWLA